jgi:hypothetical protein
LFRPVRALAAVADLDTTSYQYITGEDIKIIGRHCTINESLPDFKNLPVFTLMNSHIVVLADVLRPCGCEDESFIDSKNALITVNACDHMMVTMTVTLSRAVLQTPSALSLNVCTPLIQDAISPRRRGTHSSSSLLCHHTPYRTRISRRNHWMISLVVKALQLYRHIRCDIHLLSELFELITA